MFAVYITHPQVLIDPEVPVPEWGLSATGAARAETAARLSWVQALSRIVSSDEVKAKETAAFFGRATGIEPEILPDFHENDRSATGFLPPDVFEAAADAFFAEPEKSFRGWERAVDAQKRIVTAVNDVLARHDTRQPVAFVGHGGVGTLLKCHLKGVEISRAEDQGAGGGGNLFAFSLSERSVLCDWTPIETWQGWTGQ